MSSRYQVFNRLLFGAAVGVLGTSFASAQTTPEQAGRRQEPRNPAAIQQLRDSGALQVATHPATGAARFVSFAPGTGSKAMGIAAMATPKQKADTVWARHGAIFGIEDPAQLQLRATRQDAMGWSHVDYDQVYQGVPVYAAVMKAHFDARGELRALNGTFIPELNLNVTPSRTTEQAAATALARVSAQKSGARNLRAQEPQLYVYREGLVKGVAGPNHLAYRVEIGNGGNVREFVFVDAHSGRIVDQHTGIHERLSRNVFDGEHARQDGAPGFPDAPFWKEGDAFPSTGACVEKDGQLPCNPEADNVILGSGDAFGFFFRSFGRDSWDGEGAPMLAAFDNGESCPGAFWNGTFTSFCNFVTSDDTLGHEWGHAYTEATHGLVGAFQPGSLNESYSDIWGETIDRINSRGTDNLSGRRTDGVCSRFQLFDPIVRVNSPAGIGDLATRRATFGPVLDATGITGDVVAATPAHGCGPLTNGAAVAGRVALIDRGGCDLTDKALNAQDAGAVAVIFADIQDAFLKKAEGVDLRVTIPSAGISQSAGAQIKARLAAGRVNVTLKVQRPAVTDNSIRWIMGEDDYDHGVRDLWNPGCLGHPAKVSDVKYDCTDDSRGEHANAGVPNHAYALTVDGGVFNGQTIQGIGLVKAAHIYYRAMTVYQTPATDFPDHADAIKQSCTDLIGVNLKDIQSGHPSGQVLAAADCAQVDRAALAVELRRPPTQCNFPPLLDPKAPALCPAGTTVNNVLFENFEAEPVGWSVSREVVVPGEFIERDWERVSQLPQRRPGSAFFATDRTEAACGGPPSQSGVLFLTSPSIRVPAGPQPLVSFTHYVAVEAPGDPEAPGFDGGNLKVSVNGGPFTLVPARGYTFNAYNRDLVTEETTNPLAGQPAFSGANDGGFEGSFGDSRINLTGIAEAGDTVQFRFEFATDECTDFPVWDGWYVDDVRVYSCVAPNPKIKIKDASVTEGHSGKRPIKFQVTLSGATHKTVKVKYQTVNKTAHAGSDYEHKSGTVTLSPGQVKKTVTINVIGDNHAEPDETFEVKLSSPQNGQIEDGTAKGTIRNDDGHHLSILNDDPTPGSE